MAKLNYLRAVCALVFIVLCACSRDETVIVSHDKEFSLTLSPGIQQQNNLHQNAEIQIADSSKSLYLIVLYHNQI